MRIWPVIALLIATSTAAGAQPAESTIANSTSAAVRPQLVGAMMTRGYHVAQESQSFIVFEKPADNAAAMFLFGTRMNMVPVSRVSFTMADMAGGTRIMGDSAIIANAGTAFERRNDITATDRTAIQEILSGISAPAAQPASP